MTNSNRVKRLHELYAQLPTINCQGRCWKACGPVMFSRAEQRLIENVYGTFPHPDATLTCNFLDKETHRCKIYQHRPAICRAFGVTDNPLLICIHGCKPEVQISQQSLSQILQAIDSIEGSATPRQRNALAKALKEHKTLSMIADEIETIENL